MSVFVASDDIMKSRHVGAVFLSIDAAFKTGESEPEAYPIKFYKSRTKSRDICATEDEKLGSLWIQTKCENKRSHGIRTSIKMRVRLTRTTELSMHQTWPAEAMLSGDVALMQKHVEKVFIQPSYSGLYVNMDRSHDHGMDARDVEFIKAVGSSIGVESDDAAIDAGCLPALCGGVDVIDSSKQSRRPSHLFNRGSNHAVEERKAGKLLLPYCKERANMNNSAFIIPWEQVLSVDIVTTSILCLTITVNKFFDGNRYEPVDTTFFVTNCAANKLRSFINERIVFNGFRQRIRNFMDPHSMTIIDFKPPLQEVQRLMPDDINENEISFDPSSCELSEVSLIASELDEDAKAVEEMATKYLSNMSQLDDDDEIKQTMRDDRTVMLRRASRLRIYMAVIFGANFNVGQLPEADELSEKLTLMVEKDRDAMMSIVLSDDVATNGNRLDYLLDISESRIRDLAISSWGEDRSKVCTALSKMANLYLVEMVELLGMFFEGNQNVRRKNGLQSKISLINMYMTNNDRFARMLESAVRPYRLVPSPRPTFSLFLNINSLVGWYSALLRTEMTSVVNQVVGAWKDRAKDVSGEASKYSASIPWCPLRLSGQSGLFVSYLPEDCVEYLRNYLKIATIDESKIEYSNFQDLLKKLSMQIILSFAVSFVHLGEHYWTALQSQVWPVLPSGSADDLLDERLEWLCSVCNDASRIVHEKLVSGAFATEMREIRDGLDVNAPSDLRKGLKSIDHTLDQCDISFQRVVTCALDSVACIIFKRLQPETWLKDQPGVSRAYDFADTRFDKFIRQLSNFLSELVDYLDPHCYKRLLDVCAGKIITIVLYILRKAQIARRTYDFGGDQAAKMAMDAALIKSSIVDLFHDIQNTPAMMHQGKKGFKAQPVYKEIEAKEVIEKFNAVDFALQIIACHDVNFNGESQEMLKLAVLKLHSLAIRHREDALAVAALADVCLSLRQRVFDQQHERVGRKPVHYTPQLIDDGRDEKEGYFARRGTYLSYLTGEADPAASSHSTPHRSSSMFSYLSSATKGLPSGSADNIHGVAASVAAMSAATIGGAPLPLVPDSEYDAMIEYLGLLTAVVGEIRSTFEKPHEDDIVYDELFAINPVSRVFRKEASRGQLKNLPLDTLLYFSFLPARSADNDHAAGGGGKQSKMTSIVVRDVSVTSLVSWQPLKPKVSAYTFAPYCYSCNHRIITAVTVTSLLLSLQFVLEFVVGKEVVRTPPQQSVTSGVVFEVGDILISVPEHYILGDMVSVATLMPFVTSDSD